MILSSIHVPRISVGLGLSLLTPLYFGLVSLRYATASDFIIQDDARLHLVWLQRLIQPQLFAHDPIADYYTAVQAAGFKAFYGMVAGLGIAPLTCAKLLPIALALVSTVYLYRFTLLLLPLPMSGVFTTLVFNQNIWLKDDLISATPRAFVYPIFAAFLYYLARRSSISCLLTLMLQGLFYPQMMLVSVGILTLRLVEWCQGSLRLSRCSRDYRMWLVAIALTAVLLWGFSDQVAEQVGSLTTLKQMQRMPEFQRHGRGEYFGVPLWDFVFAGSSGLRFPLFPPIIVIGALLPWLLRVTPSESRRVRWQFWLPLKLQITPQIRLLGQLFLSALAWFLLAHLTFPRLYLPSRYTFYSFRFLLAIATGLVLTLIADRLWHRCKQIWQSSLSQSSLSQSSLSQSSLSQSSLSQSSLSQSSRTWSLVARIKVVLIGLMISPLVIVPAIPTLFLPCQDWIVGENPGIYQRLAQLPTDTLIATLSPEGSNIPAFTQRSVLVAEELALPYHTKFYQVMLQRMSDLVQAQYSPDPAKLQSLIQTYGIDIWMVDQNFAQADYLAQQAWLINSSIGRTVVDRIDQLHQGMQPALVDLVPSCSIFTEKTLILLDTQCISRKVSHS